MRNMSFAMTTEQFKARTKTVTRRWNWEFLNPGDKLRGVEKSMGIPKGQKMKVLDHIEVVSVRREPLNAITQEDVIKEGFPEWTPQQFIKMLLEKSPKKTEQDMITRIEFKYLDGHAV